MTSGKAPARPAPDPGPRSGLKACSLLPRYDLLKYRSPGVCAAIDKLREYLTVLPRPGSNKHV